jgi:UDP-3-O-[3-hydroxymyristoyl] glucosamine N-acyltransferase
MSAPLFFQRGQGLSVREIAALAGGEPRGAGDLDRRVTGIALLDRAGPSDLTFLDKPKFIEQAAKTRSAACLTAERFAGHLPAHVTVLVTRDPYRAFVEAARALFPAALRPASLFEASGLTPGAFVHPSARIESGATIDPGVVIGPRAEIGAGTVIGAGAAIGPRVRIGRDCSVGANVTIAHALIGDRVIVHPGCTIGQDGFGYVMGASGHRKVPQVGRVIIQDDVEIGANSTVDRGALGDTVIGEGTKIDNLVQVAHNVVIGRHCIVAGQCGISGSCTIGDGVMMGGQVGLADHVTIGPGAMLAAQSGVMRDIPAGERWMGSPARPVKQHHRELIMLERLAARRMADRGKGQPEEGD